MPAYISFQYNHLVLEPWISLTEIEVKAGEPRIWKMTKFDHECIMDTCIHITLWLNE